MGRLICDTGILVAGVRGLAPAWCEPVDDVIVPAIVVAEYLTGVLLDGDPARQALQRAFLKQVLDVMPVEDYTPTVAEHHAALLAHVRTEGTPRGAHDLIIAATARSTGRTLVTTDAAARFDELPGVQVQLVTPRTRARRAKAKK